MTFLSQPRAERPVPRVAVRRRILPRDFVAGLAFFLAIGFSAALAFGLFGG